MRPGALVVRLYEAWGRRGPVTLQLPWKPAGRSGPICWSDELGELPVEDVHVSFDISPFEIVTLLSSRPEAADCRLGPVALTDRRARPDRAANAR